MKTTPDKLVVGHHPDVGELHVGDFVSVSSGNPSNPYLARIAGKSNDPECIVIQWCWRPTELLDFMAKSNFTIPEGRTEKSFAQNEVVLGTRTEQIQIKSILGRTDVFLISDVAEGKHQFDSWFFYRQVVVDDKDNQWRFEPPLIASVVDLTAANHSRMVENPGKILRYCSARLSFACDSDLMYDVGDERYKEVWEPNEPFTCPSCADEENGFESASREKKMLGIEWLGSVDLSAIDAPSDDTKRRAVIEKFYNAIEETGYDDASEPVITRGDLLRFFCIELEREIHDSTLGKPRDYKSRVYTISFNLSDKRNESIRRRIVEGEFSPRSLANADSETLASEQVKISRQEQRDKYFTTQVLKPKEDEGAELKKQRVAMGEVNTHLLHAVESLNNPAEPPPMSQYEREDEPMEESTQVEEVAQQLGESGAVNESDAPVDEAMQEPIRSPQDLKMDHARQRLQEVAEKIKQQLNRLEYEAQRSASIALVDYIMNHV